MPPKNHPVRGSSTGRPLMAALDLLGRRWSLRIMWELKQGPVGARALMERCGEMSSSVLYARLGDLREAGLVRQGEDDRYELTEIGRQLGRAIEPLDSWSQRWVDQTLSDG